MARLSIVRRAGYAPEVEDHTRRDGRVGNARAEGARVPSRAAAHAPSARGGHNQSTSAQSGNRGARRARLRACSQRVGRPRDARSSSGPFAWNGTQCPSHLSDECCHGGARHCGPADDDHRHGGRRLTPRLPVRLPQPALDPVTRHGPTHLATYREPGPPYPAGLVGTPEHNHQGPIDPFAAPEQRLEIGAAGQPLASGKRSR
jgi:hypothetical protein